jgi:ABC-type uncharacterized transport system permease subunit
MDGSDLGLWGVPLAMLAGAIRVSTPFIFVSLGECLTERSGRINLGLEGTLMMGAMSPWLGVLVAGFVGLLLGALHAGLCKLPKVNDIAVGIAMMLLRHRSRLLLRQALHPAQGAAARRHPARRLDRQPALASRRCRSIRCSSSASCWPVRCGLGAEATRAGA